MCGAFASTPHAATTTRVRALFDCVERRPSAFAKATADRRSLSGGWSGLLPSGPRRTLGSFSRSPRQSTDMPDLHSRCARATPRSPACAGRRSGRTAHDPGCSTRSPACTRRPHAHAGHDPASMARFRSRTTRGRAFPTASPAPPAVSSRPRAHRRREPPGRTVRQRESTRRPNDYRERRSDFCEELGPTR